MTRRKELRELGLVLSAINTAWSRGVSPSPAGPLLGRYVVLTDQGKTHFEAMHDLKSWCHANHISFRTPG